MAEHARDTIAAIATPPGPGRRGIVRVSGPEAARLVRATVRAARPDFDPTQARLCARGRFEDGHGTQPVLCLWMRAPRSFTREDVAEFHLPGAQPLLARALQRLLALGARAASAGEFTRRAFLNGRLDLSRAEGVLAMTEAANEAERAAAAHLLDGGLQVHVELIRERLLGLTTLCEASLDFDEAETGHVPRAELVAGLDGARQALARAQAFSVQRAAQSGLPRVLLLGAPNAGKSTLWNVLTGGRALVSAEAGTTRDALEGTWNVPGCACRLIDGPGLGPEEPGPGAQAQALFARARQQADLILWVVDATHPSLASVPEGARLVAWSKIDLAAAGSPPDPARFTPRLPVVAFSSQSGAGLRALAEAVARLLAGSPEEAPVAGSIRGVHARHHEALARAAAALCEAEELLLSVAPLDLSAEALRGGLVALDELSGRTTPEDVLERIFARFCLGK